MSDTARQRVPVPADVELPDKLVAGLTGRQVVITAIAVLVIWAGFEATRTGAAAAGVRGPGRPGRGGRHRAGDRAARRADPGPAAGRRVAAGPLPPPDGHRPRRRPGAPGLGLPRAGPAGRAAAGPGEAAVAAGHPGRGDRAGRRRRRRRVRGVDGELRAAQPGRAGRADRRLRPVAALAHRPGADPDPHRARGPGLGDHPAPRRTPRRCRTPRWNTPRSPTRVSWPGWAPPGRCSPGRCCWSPGKPAAPPPAGPAARPGGPPSAPPRPPGCWPAPTCKPGRWTAPRSPRCWPPPATPAARTARSGWPRPAPSPGSAMPPSGAAAGRRARRRAGRAARPARRRDRRPACRDRRGLRRHPGGDRVPGRGRARVAGAADLLPRPAGHRAAHRAGPARGRRGPAAAAACPAGVLPPDLGRAGPAGRPGHRGRRRGRPRAGLPGRPRRGQAVPAGPVPDRARRGPR